MAVPRRQQLRQPKPLVVLGLGLLFLGLGVNTVQRAAFMSVERTDFTVYQAAGRAILEGTPLYEAANTRGWLYMYLPIFAVLMVPLAVLPTAVGAGVWYLISLATLLDSARRCARLAEQYAGPSRLGEFWTFVGALVLTGWPWMSGLARGQASVMLAWLTIVAIDCFLRDERGKAGRRWIGAFTLALATTMRVFPALLGIWMLLERRWRAVLTCLLAGVALTIVIPGLVFGPVQNLRLIQEWVTRIALPAGNVAHEEDVRYAQMIDPRIFKNQSLQAVTIRLMAPTRRTQQDAAEIYAWWLSATISAGLLAATTIACWRNRARQSAALVGAAAFVMLTLFLAPVSWAHNYSRAMLPATVVLVLALPAGAPARRGFVVALCLWVGAVMSCLLVVGYYAGGFLFGGLALWAALVGELTIAKPRPPQGDTVVT